MIFRLDKVINTKYKMSDLELNIYTGPMFAGKTTRLIKHYNELDVNNELEKIAFKYIKDTRYEEIDDNKSDLSMKMIYSHDKEKIRSIPISSCDEILPIIKKIKDTYGTSIKYLFLDEGQFFPKVKDWFDTLKNIMLDTNHTEHHYLKHLLEVNISGLDYDANGNIFNTQFYSLSNQANYLLVAVSKCYKCGGNAQYTILLDTKSKKNMDGNILVGDNSIYQPACQEHINFSLKF